MLEATKALKDPASSTLSRILVSLFLLLYGLTSTASVVQAWVQRYSNAVESRDDAKKVLADSDGNVIVAGITDAGLTGSDILVIKHSNLGVPLWTNRFDGTMNSSDAVRGLAVDGAGNVFVTGSSYNGTSHDFVTLAYSSAGVPLWTNFYNGPGDSTDSAAAVAVDSGGNVFVTGGSDHFATIKYSGSGVPLWTNRLSFSPFSSDVAEAIAVDETGTVFVTGTSSSDFLTVAYSNSGVLLWTNRYNGPGNNLDQVRAIAVDHSNHVFVTGYSYSGSSASSADYATIAYSSSGTALWTNRYNGPGSNVDQAVAIAVDNFGRVFVTGYSYSSNLVSSADYATIAYSITGAALWTNRYNGPLKAEDVATAVTTDGTNVLVTGYSMAVAFSHGYATIKYSGAGVPVWTNFFNGPTSGADEAAAVATDAGGNVVVTGSSFGPGGSQDYATIEYSSAGVALWTNRHNAASLGNAHDYPQAVALDNSGNVIVTGTSVGLVGSFLTDGYATIKYSSAGVPLWTNRYDEGGGVSSAAVATDASDNVFVTVTANGPGNNRLDYTTIKYSSAGVSLWTNRYNAAEFFDDLASAVAVDGDGNVVVTGYSSGTGDYATIKYSNEGTALWTNHCVGIYIFDPVPALALDANGNVIVAGHGFLGSGNPYDYLTVKYSSAGAPLWTNYYNGPKNNDDRLLAVAVDSSGNVFVTGYSCTNNSSSSSDYLTIAYSGGGVPLWTNSYNGPANDQDVPVAVATDTGGNVYVTGYSIGNGTYQDYATIKYSNAGVPLWTNRYNGPANGYDTPAAIAVDGIGHVFVTGNSDFGNFLDPMDFATVVYSSAGVPLGTNRYNGLRGPDAPQPRTSLAVGPGGAVYVTGASDGSRSIGDVVYYDYATVKYALTAPEITDQPDSLTNVIGSTAAFSVAATDSGSLNYQWRRNETNLFDGANVSGATTTALTLTNCGISDAGDYTVVVTGPFGSVTSAVAALTIVWPASLVSSPFHDGDEFVARYSGTPGITYTVEFTEALSPVDWHKATNVVAATTDMGLGIGGFEFREATTNAPQRFYRVVFPAY